MHEKPLGHETVAVPGNRTGYIAEVGKMKRANGKLTGKWFHSRKDGAIHWQGRVIAHGRDGFARVQLFSWLDGRPTDRKRVHVQQMVDWTFYADDREMRRAYSRSLGQTKADFAWSEKVLRMLR